MFGDLLVDLTQPRKESMNLKIGQQKLSKLKDKKVGRKQQNIQELGGQYLFHISVIKVMGLDEITVG